MRAFFCLGNNKSEKQGGGENMTDIERREIVEAISAADNALNHLNSARRYLQIYIAFEHLRSAVCSCALVLPYSYQVTPQRV